MAGDELPLTLTLSVDLMIQKLDYSYSIPSKVDEFVIGTAPGAPCSVKTQGSCIGNRCSGAVEINQYGICFVGFEMKAPEADGIDCWEHSIVDGTSVGDEAYQNARNAAEKACQSQF